MLSSPRRLLLAAIIILSSALAIPRSATAQSLDDLELRKRQKQSRFGFGVLGLFETSTSLNRDRPTLTNLLYVAPQLKIGDRLRVRLNAGVYRHWLARQANPWDLTDISLQVSHLGIYREPHSGILLSGSLRYALPTSKTSRNAGSYGQLRGMFKLSRTLFSRLFLASEFSLFKSFHDKTTWDTAEGDTGAFSGGGSYDAFVRNNLSYGFSEQLTASVKVFSGLDLSLIGALLQGRQYEGEAHAGLPARRTVWLHHMRFVIDATLSLGALAGVDSKEASGAGKLLARSYLSLGYALFAPQLRDGDGRSLNPFDARYASAYLDLLVIY